MPDTALPTAVLVGRYWDTLPDGSPVCVDLHATDEHPPLPTGSFWYLPASGLDVGCAHRRVLGRAVRVARGLMPRYSGTVSLGDPLHVQEEADGLAGHPAWVVTPDHEPGCPAFQRLGVCQVVGWLRPNGPDDLEGYLVEAVTPVRDEACRRLADEGHVLLLSGLAVLPIPVGEAF